MKLRIRDFIPINLGILIGTGILAMSPTVLLNVLNVVVNMNYWLGICLNIAVLKLKGKKMKLAEGN